MDCDSLLSKTGADGLEKNTVLFSGKIKYVGGRP